MEDRGFKKLKGKTIKDIRIDAVNSVRLLCEDGTVFTIDADDTFHGIGVPRLTRESKKLEAFPKPVREKKFSPVPAAPKLPTELGDAWPFPKSDDFVMGKPKVEPLKTKM